MDHLYIHVPFCTGKCGYCAFYSVTRPAAEGAYLDALATELRLACAPGGRVSPLTVYIGGGTPSALGDEHFTRLLATVRAHIEPARLREWTVEANPGTLSASKRRALAAAGVNRISLGAQSFDDAVLARIGRRHTVADIGATVEALRADGFDNVGLDLIAGLPSVAADAWERTLHAALDLRPEHISVYALSIEPGTAFHDLQARGRLQAASEDEEIAAMAQAERLLEAAGFEHYETSNYAQPGRACLHNLACWRGGDYLGVGPAAASRIGLCRRTNIADLDAYTAALATEAEPPREEERLAPITDRTERLIFAFRLAEGASPADAAQGDEDLLEFWLTTLASLRRNGLVAPHGERWRLTPRGRDLADAVAGELIPPD